MCSFDTLVQFLALLAILYVVFLILGELVNWIAFFTYTPPSLSQFGSWGLVTGSTRGIGLAFANELAQRGFNLVLVSKSKQKLEETAEKLKESYKIDVKIVEVDFRDPALDVIKKLENLAEDLEIGIVINNVGIALAYPEEFNNLDHFMIQDIIKVNVESVTTVTKVFLPSMISRGRGLIVNIGSMAALLPGPLMSVYAASKAYVDKFTSCLDLECRRNGIIVQCFSPGFVATKMSRFRRASTFVPSPEEYARSVLSKIGFSGTSSGYWAHDLQLLYARLHANELANQKMYEKATKARSKLREKMKPKSDNMQRAETK